MKKFTIKALGVLLIALVALPAAAQTLEPEVIPLPDPRSPYEEGKRNSLGFNLFINNFGFGIGGQYSRYISPGGQIFFKTGVTGIRDITEQSFQDFFTGQRIIPNKFNRALGIPLLVGYKHRLFGRKIDDNFRFFVSGAAGPAMAFVFPYLDDIDGSGYRNSFIVGNSRVVEPINDFFTGWNEGSIEWGLNGEFSVGVDIGDNFSKLTTVQFTYFAYYFDQGLQIMEPFRPVVDSNGQIVGREPFFDKQKFFGTPTISFIFGGIW
ncbi:MAG: hypothetical protein R3211_02660 [Balneolaceae bacterium]|nr:hypothetical protein [Balneolaceae bacterium]